MSKDIDNIFSDKMGEKITEELKAKRKKYNSKIISKAITLTLIIIMFLAVLVNIINDKILEHTFQTQSSIIDGEYTIMHPSEFIGERSYLETGLFKSVTSYEIGKFIGNRVIDAGTYNLTSGIQVGRVGGIYNEVREQYIDEYLENRDYNTNGLRKLYFMLPYVNYEDTINDFKYLEQIDGNKYVEIVISFDKEYSYEEVNESFDSDKISFYWIDTLTEDEKDAYKEFNDYLTDKEVIGIKSLTVNGDIIKDEKERLNEYKQAITYLKHKKYRGMARLSDENYTNISGIVIQGTANELEKIKNNSMIKHAVLGNIVDKF